MSALICSWWIAPNFLQGTYQLAGRFNCQYSTVYQQSKGKTPLRPRVSEAGKYRHFSSLFISSKFQVTGFKTSIPKTRGFIYLFKEIALFIYLKSFKKLAVTLRNTKSNDSPPANTSGGKSSNSSKNALSPLLSTQESKSELQIYEIYPVPITHQFYPLGTTNSNKTVFPTGIPTVPILVSHCLWILLTIWNRVIQGQGFHPLPIRCCHTLIKCFMGGQRQQVCFICFNVSVKSSILKL